jgi:hypothetical protein
VFDAQWNHEPLIDLPLIGKLLTIVFSILILVITIISTYNSKKSDLAFGAFIIAGIILNPASIDYHYMLMLIPIFILVDWLRKNPSTTLWTLFLICFASIALNLPNISPKITGGIWAFFAYPKLYGALGLWALSLRVAYISKFSESGLVN